MSTDKTKWIFDEKDVGKDFDEAGDRGVGFGPAADFTESLGHGAQDEATLRDYGAEKTRPIPQEARTVIAHAGNAAAYGREEGFDAATDPCVGWLVVVKGFGLGRSVPLGAGVNAIGRDPDERVPLPFGDTLISMRDHARIYYDDEERAFFIGHGSGKNITRMNGAIVANPVPLPNGAIIQLTKATHLRFVAFCSPDFDWSDIKGADAQTLQ